MRDSGQAALKAAGLIALAGAVAMLYRLNQQSQSRRMLRQDAVRKLRESGEHFFAIPAQVPTSDTTTDGVGFEPTVRY